MRHLWKLAILLAAFSDLPAASQSDPLAALLAKPKFERTLFYSGIKAPQDKPRLTGIVNDAIAAISALPAPRDEARARARLKRAIADLAEFARDDRGQAYRYLVEAWRAAGFKGESGLFPVADDHVLFPF